MVSYMYVKNHLGKSNGTNGKEEEKRERKG